MRRIEFAGEVQDLKKEFRKEVRELKNEFGREVHDLKKETRELSSKLSLFLQRFDNTGILCPIILM